MLALTLVLGEHEFLWRVGHVYNIHHSVLAASCLLPHSMQILGWVRLTSTWLSTKQQNSSQTSKTHHPMLVLTRFHMDLDKSSPAFLTSFICCMSQTNLCRYRPKYDLCKYNFTVRVMSLWNSLPTHVITAVSVDSLKNRLDKFWANEEARFDYKANLSGSGFARCF